MMVILWILGFTLLHAIAADSQGTQNFDLSIFPLSMDDPSPQQTDEEEIQNLPHSLPPDIDHLVEVENEGKEVDKLVLDNKNIFDPRPTKNLQTDESSTVEDIINKRSFIFDDAPSGMHIGCDEAPLQNVVAENADVFEVSAPCNYGKHDMSVGEVLDSIPRQLYGDGSSTAIRAVKPGIREVINAEYDPLQNFGRPSPQYGKQQQDNNDSQQQQQQQQEHYSPTIQEKIFALGVPGLSFF